MQNPYEVTVLYKKDEVEEFKTARQLDVSDFDPYEMLIDLDQVATVETSLVNESLVSIVAMKSGHTFNVLANYKSLKKLILTRVNAFEKFFEKVNKA